ncbi:sensor histidine kinase [Chlorobium sp. N1]|uniref:sensor histidine kinase n=1 Tax=Chlorobium sp. N1 TaxID=2491138 RepID=UPI00103A04FD|nr:sensor histidine kinase [Chlorobium sp. N1]TCD47549.1 hypothetical protein E0L29_06750 [Chlorobium sp. N1]
MRPFALLRPLRPLLPLLLLLLFPFGAGAAVPALVVDRPEGVALGGHLEALEDPSGRLGLPELLKGSGGRVFRPLPGGLLAGYTRSVWWVRCSLRGGAESEREARLFLKAERPEQMEVFVQRPRSDPRLASSYRSWRFGRGEAGSGPGEPSVPLELDSSAPVRLFVRLQSSTPVVLDGTVVALSRAAAHAGRDLVANGLFLGGASVAVFASLLFFRVFADWRFLLLALYVADMFVYYMALRGMEGYLLPAGGSGFVSFWFRISDGFAALVFSLLAHRLFGEQAPGWALAVLRGVSVAGALSIGGLAAGYGALTAPLLAASVFVMLVVLSWVSGRMLPRVSRWWVLLFLAFAAAVVLYVLYFLRLLGLAQPSAVSMEVMQSASAVQVLFVLAFLVAVVLRQGESLVASVRSAEAEGRRIADGLTAHLRVRRGRLESSIIRQHQEGARLTRFLALLSHEYRTPLAIMQGAVELYERRGAEEAGLPVLSRMRRALRRLMEVMERSLERSRLGDEGEEPAFGRVVLGGYVQRQVELAGAMWPERPFRFSEARCRGSVRGDRALLNTALFNLLDNARKYAVAGTEVEVRCRLEGREAVVEVRNRAVAAAAARVREAAFAFEGAGPNLESRKGGAGLWIVRRILVRHGGRLECSFSEPDGVLVSMRLPLSAEEGR